MTGAINDNERMLGGVTAMGDTYSGEAAAPSIAVNTTTKDELLRRAKAAIDSGESHLRDAAEVVALAQQDFKATQRDIAEAVGRSLGWVNRLLKWRRSGYKESSPFGPTTKAGRVQHAEHRAKASRPRKAKAQAADGGTANSADAEESTSTEAETSTSRKPSPKQAMHELKWAIDHWWRHLDDAGKGEVTEHVLKKMKGQTVPDIVGMQP